MTEDEARAWLAAHVPRETIIRMERLVGLVAEASVGQNLVARSTIEMIWARHVVDSAQLARMIGDGATLDIGSGAGFPGLVIALMGGDAMTLVEPRRLRAEFLADAAAALRLDRVLILQKRVEAVTAPPFATIVARAVAPLASLFAMAELVADGATRWVLPKGRNAQSELAAARETWHGDFQLIDSVSDAEATIIVATNVRRKAKRGSGE